MPEELALDQGWGDGAAVERHEGLRGAPRQAMDRAGGDFLAAAGGASDEDGCVRLGDAADDFEDLGHDRGAPYQVAQPSRFLQLGAESLDFRLEPAPVRQTVENDLELSGPERLQQIVNRSGAERLDGVVDRALAGDDNPLAIRVGLPRRAKDFDSVAVGKVDVDDQEARIELLDGAARLLHGAD